MEKRIGHIVFTKNRPLQLHGYLESLYRFFPAERMQTCILWKEELFTESYQEVFKTFSQAEVIRETNFHADCNTLISQLKTPYVLFGIDDVLFFDAVDWTVIETAFDVLGDALFGFSLRLDPRQLEADRQAGTLDKQEISGQTAYTVDWTKGRTANSRYPFELCATIYRTRDIQRIFRASQNANPFIRGCFAPGGLLVPASGNSPGRRKLLKKLGYFFSPNTLESWTQRWIQKHPDQAGRLLAFQKICASAVQVNMVNTSTANEYDDAGDLTVEALAEKYKAGWRVDINRLVQDKPLQTHINSDCFLLTKK